MKSNLKFSTSLLLLIGSFNIVAQDFELFKIQSTYYPQQPIEESAADREIGFWEWNGRLAIPQPFENKKTVLLHQLSYTNLRVEMAGTFPNGATEAGKDYHTITYGLSWIQNVNPEWRLMVTMIPTIASDLAKPLNGDDFLFLANAMAMSTKNDKFRYGFGLAYTTSFGRQLVIPMGMIKYTAGKTTFDILLPNKLSVMLNADKKFNYGGQVRLDGGVFTNSSEIAIVSEQINSTGYSRMNMGPMMTIKLKQAIKLNLEGGFAVGRRLDFIDVEEERMDRTPENGPYFKVGLSFSPMAQMSGQNPNN